MKRRLRRRLVSQLVPVVLVAWAIAAGSSGASSAASDTRASLSRAALPTITQALVLPLPRGTRGPVFTDPVEGRIVRGDWKPPVAGVGGWNRIEAMSPGEFEDDSLENGYADAMIDSPSDQILLLVEKGNRSVIVNGEPRVGDPYGLGITRIPVFLRRGRNELLFKVSGGALTARFERPAAPAFLESRDLTAPDIIVRSASGGDDADRNGGDPEPPIRVGVIVTNATTGWMRGLSIGSVPEGLASDPRKGATPVAPIPPLGFRKVPFGFPPCQLLKAGGRCPCSLVLFDAKGRVLSRIEIALDVKRAGETHKETFVSAIDGSVQYYSVVPAAAEPAASPLQAPALILSLHGASVEATGQAAAYLPKSWATIVAPTNRRPYGFDCEDWGRMDALEVLELAKIAYGADPSRIYLTGHSMGGHGTWSIGSTFPGLFAAIAPSAGWSDFWSYSGAAEWKEASPVASILMRASNGSRTLLMERNLASLGVYVLHGDADDNVPVDQARAMRSRLAGFHPNFAYYERPGAGHWWGNECMDWPPLFDFLRRNVRAEPKDAEHVDFTTVNPGVSSRYRWIEIQAQERSLLPSRIEADRPREGDADGALAIRTTNVLRFSISLRPFTSAVTIDGEAIAVAPGTGSPVFAHSRTGDARTPHWSLLQEDAPVPSARKDPLRSGPFKDAFRNRMVFVIATHGTPAENGWALAKARYDAETFWYRGNGSVEILSDSEFSPVIVDAHRNVILYGNADTNSAWGALLPSSPIEVRRGFVRVGGGRIEGSDLACLFIYPRAGSPDASVGVVSGTGLAGSRLTNQLPYFVSGVGYPDWIVIGAEMSDPVMPRGIDGVRAAGFFDADWRISADDSSWR